MAALAETCSHVGAILHWVEATVRIQKNVACTSKRLKLELSSPSGFISSSVSECKIALPSEYERDDFSMRLPKRTKGSH